MQTVVCNGVDFHVEYDNNGDLITIRDCNNNDLLEAVIDRNLETIVVTNIEDGTDDSVDYYQFCDNTPDLVDWMCATLFE